MTVPTGICRPAESVTNALVPGVARRPPEEWFFSDGRKPDRETCRQFVSQDLAKAFGRAEQWLSGMEVHLRFKGLTYETLSDESFLEAAGKAGLDVERLHEEFNAAKASGRAEYRQPG